MTPKEGLATVKEGATGAEVQEKMHKARVEKILLVNDEFQLKGMITAKDFHKAESKPHSCKDGHRRLHVCAPVCDAPGNQDRVQALV